MDGAFKDMTYSSLFACSECGYSLEELEPRLFSFNSPAGACTACDGLGTERRTAKIKLELEENPDMLGEYNIARAIATFNKRINPLLVVFDKEVREKLLVTDPNDRGFFTKDQCKLISGLPFKEGDQDKLEDLLQIEERELDYWGKRGIDPNYIYDLAEEGWENVIDTSKLINYVN